MEILVIKTFAIIVMLLCVTAVTARKNHAFETMWEFWGLFIATLALVFIIPMTSMPINIILALVFAGLFGAMVGPGIKGMMMSYVARKGLEKKGFSKAQQKSMSEEEFNSAMATVVSDTNSAEYKSLIEDWNNILTMAFASTAVMTFVTAMAVYVLDFDFSIMGKVLFVALIGLIVMGFLNMFFFKSPLVRLIGSYVGAVVFSLYLLYDFNQLEALVATGDTSWDTAVRMGTSVYIDIVNLFMDLLDILSSR